MNRFWQSFYKQADKTDKQWDAMDRSQIAKRVGGSAAIGAGLGGLAGSISGMARGKGLKRGLIGAGLGALVGGGTLGAADAKSYLGNSKKARKLYHEGMAWKALKNKRPEEL